MEDIFQLIRANELDKYNSLVTSVEINITNEFGQNLLQQAIASNNVPICIDLIQREININHTDKKGQTPLHYSASNKNYYMSEIILKNGGDLTLKDIYGNTPLWTAVFNSRGYYEIVDLFIRFGANPFSKNNNNKSPMDFAIQIRDNRLIKILN